VAVRLPLSYGPYTFYDLFVRGTAQALRAGQEFQRFHIGRIAEREALKADRIEDCNWWQV
jgi:hypothetical protein